jgi:hypothetical protein
MMKAFKKITLTLFISSEEPERPVEKRKNDDRGDRGNRGGDKRDDGGKKGKRP